jgi:hypothetical protein
MLAEDIARLMSVIPQESVIRAAAEPNGSGIKASPFGYLKGEGIDAGAGEPEWIVGKDRYKADNIFDSLNPIDGKVTGAGKFENLIEFGMFRIISNSFCVLILCSRQVRNGKI